MVINKSSAIADKRFFQKVYGWMFLGLVISGLVGLFVASSPAVLEIVLGNVWIFYLLVIVELVLVVSLVGLVNRISASTALVLFILYSLITGITLSVVFLVYTLGSIGMVFFIAAGMFGAMSIYGYVTKEDLTSFGKILFMGLIGIIIASIVNLFLRSPGFDYVISFIGVVIFTGLTAYDTQRIKEMGRGREGSEGYKKAAIMGALTLYLDFINLFLQLLKLFGKRRD